MILRKPFTLINFLLDQQFILILNYLFIFLYTQLKHELYHHF